MADASILASTGALDFEAGLIRRAQRGDTAAVETLYRKNVGSVYALCLRMSADAARAEELTKDTFLRTWERIGSGREPFLDLASSACGKRDPRRPAGQDATPFQDRAGAGMAAAVVLLAAAAVTSTLWRATSAGPVAPAPIAAARYLDDAPDLREAEEEFRKATVKLMATLERRKADLPSRTIADLAESLRVVNQAIAETGAALARDPANHWLGRLLTDIYATKVDLLSKAVRIPGAASKHKYQG